MEKDWNINGKHMIKIVTTNAIASGHKNDNQVHRHSSYQYKNTLIPYLGSNTNNL